MTGPLDLDAIEDRAGERRVLEDISALVAEVRALRKALRRIRDEDNATDAEWRAHPLSVSWYEAIARAALEGQTEGTTP